MSSLSVVGQTQTGQSILDQGISDLLVLETDDGPVLYTTSGQFGGVSAYSLGSDGSLTLEDFAYFDGAWSDDALATMTLVESPTGLQLVVAGDTGGALTSFSLSGNGMIGSAGQFSGAQVDGLGILDVYQWGNSTLFLSQPGDASIQGYVIGANNDLTASISLDSTSGTYSRDVFAIETASLAGNDYVIGASQSGQGVTAYRIGQTGLTATGNMGIEEGLGIMTPTGLEVVEIGDRCFVLVASAPGDGIGQSGAISVLELTATGDLVPTDHVIDTLDTRFGQVQSLEVLEAGGRTYVVAGGGDDGVSVFVLMPNGRLQLIDVMADNFAIGLENVSAIAAVHHGDHLHMFLSSEISPGVTEIALDVSGHGTVFETSDAGENLSGTDHDDILIGGAGRDTLNGGDGDDIIEDGAGGDQLTGGDGSDIFVLRADGSNDTIMDFDWMRDRLDLSDWPFLYDLSSLSISPTGMGAIITWRGEYLELISANGQTLTVAQVLSAIIAAPNRLPTFSEIGTAATDQFVDGTTASEALSGGAGNDTIYGYTGHDTISGEDGDDSLISGTGADLVHGGAGNDYLWGQNASDTLHGDAGSDTILGGGGDDYMDGGSEIDSLQGGGGHDTLLGGQGDDHLFSQAGNDRLEGGEGDDRIWAGLGDDTLFGGAQEDTLFGQQGHDWLFGDGGFDHLDGGSGNDTLDGGHQADRLYGGGGNDVLYGNLGPDRLFGGGGHDELNGNEGNDFLYGENGHDTLFGGPGEDLLNGGPGNDFVNGNFGNDAVSGGSGFDTVDGGKGDDDLWGNFNADIFVFSDGHGVDTIHDFAADNIYEKIDLSDINAIVDLDDVLGPGGAAQQVGTDVVIDTGGGHEIWLLNVDLSELDATDFLF